MRPVELPPDEIVYACILKQGAVLVVQTCSNSFKVLVETESYLCEAVPIVSD